MTADRHPATIVITIDGINALMLGLQGNTSVVTIAFDTLAAQGVSFDFAFSRSCDLPTALGTMMTGADGHPITSRGAGHHFFVSDCPVAIAAAEAAQFDSILEVPLTSPHAAADSVAQTRAAGFFSAAIESLESVEQGDLLWLHFSGLSAWWDAPMKMRQQYQAPDDPDVYGDVTPPDFLFDAEADDPDLLVSVQQACYAQVTTIDQVLEIFLQHLTQHSVGRTSVVIVSATRGYSLGEHGYVGIGKTLHSPSLHVPLLAKLPDALQSNQNIRSHRLIQTSAVGRWINHSESIIDDCQTIMASDSRPIFFSTKRDLAIQTATWKLMRCVDTDGIITESLFAKPDDRWEVNDVARRCPQIVDDLERKLAKRDATSADSEGT